MPKHLIEKVPGHYVVGEEVKTRGNDEEYPTFELEDGSLFSVPRDRVKSQLQEETIE